MKVIFDIEEAPKRCYDCQFCDYEFGFCHLDKESMHSDSDLFDDTERAEKGNCPIKQTGYLAEATQMVLDFIRKCEGSESYLITPDGKELFTDWGYVESGLEQIMEWAKKKENK